MRSRYGAACIGAMLVTVLPAAAAETPKHGGTLTYMIPADAPPSFDGHRETTFATVHSAAPFYSVLIRVNPDNPSSTTDFVCDLCTEMPQPTDDGKTYTFKIRDGVKFHDGSPLTAADVAASWQAIVHPPAGVTSARAELLHHGRQGRGARPCDRRVPSEVRHRRVPAGARRSLCLDLQEGDPRQGPALVREEHHGHPARSSSPATKSASRSRACATRTTISRACRTWTASSASLPRSRTCASMRSAPTARRSSSAACRPRRANSSKRLSATSSPCRPATGTAAT